MKIKTILFTGIIFSIVFLIYLTTTDKQIYYLNLSIDESNYSYDTYTANYFATKEKLEKYITNFVKQDDRVTDLIHSIEENKTITVHNKKQTIKNALIKADVVTVFVGMNDINYKVGYSSMNELYDYADSFLEDMDLLLKLLREYCKEDILILGYYNIYGSYYDEYFSYINRRIKELTKKYDMEFVETIDLYDSKNHMQDIFMSTDEHKKVYSRIQKIIDEKILK